MKGFITLLLLLVVKFGDFLQLKEEPVLKNAKRCEDLAKEPYFDIDQVVSHTWRVYYTWFMNLDSKCLDLNFKNATPSRVNRMYRDMVDYLEVQPNWDAATLFLSVGPEKHEMLLFADQGPAGIFTGVPNVVRDTDIQPRPGTVKLGKMFLKLLGDGMYLLIVDCNMGIASLSTVEKPPHRSEIKAIVNSLPLGIGKSACIADNKMSEQIFL